jgi:hypothetical protein
MANEAIVNATLSYADAAGVSQQLSCLGAQFSPSSLKPSQTKQTINTSETTIKLGDTTAPGLFMMKNLDPVNYVDVKVAASGAVFARLDPDVNANGKGSCCLVKLGSGAQAPVAVATGAACLIGFFDRMMALKAAREKPADAAVGQSQERDEGTERVLDLLAEEWKTIQGQLGGAATARGHASGPDERPGAEYRAGCTSAPTDVSVVHKPGWSLSGDGMFIHPPPNPPGGWDTVPAYPIRY